MSPEVCENKPYSYKSDLWALGVILYQLCTRKNPFQSENLVALVFKIVKEDPEPIPVEYGSDMTELVDGLLTKDVDKRWGYIEISKCPAFDQHTKSEHAGKSVGKKLTREQRKQQRVNKYIEALVSTRIYDGVHD